MTMAPGPRVPFSTRQGACFRYAVPDGWRVAEDGQFAVVLVAPDQRAVTTLVGNAGLPLHYPPNQFVFDKLSQAGYQDLRMNQPRPAPPLLGFPAAWDFDVEYVIGGIRCRGIARCSVAPAYDSCTMVIAWAASEISQWAAYAPWLPEVAAQVEVTNGAAFGASGIAQQNLMNSVMLGEQARRNREYSQQQWAEVSRTRGESEDRRHAEFREAMGPVRTYDNPFTGLPVELSAANVVYWVNLTTGQIVGDHNPAFDPRTATDADWQPLKTK